MKPRLTEGGPAHTPAENGVSDASGRERRGLLERLSAQAPRRARTPAGRASWLWKLVVLAQSVVLLWLLREPLIAWFTLSNGRTESVAGRPPDSSPTAPDMIPSAARRDIATPESPGAASPARTALATDPSLPTSVPSAGGPGDIAYYTCSMHPSVKQSSPGTCPICSMNLVPVTRTELETGVIRVDSSRRRTIGVKTEVVTTRRLQRSLRAPGRVVADETRLRDIAIKFGGTVVELKVEATGQAVHKGQVLFTLYSPELYAAQQELLLALRSQASAQTTAAPDRADYLVRAARQRLKLWDVTDAQIQKIETTGQPMEHFPILSPATGHVIEKEVVEGATVQAGQRLYRVSDLSHIWVEAEIPESDLSLMQVGQVASATLSVMQNRRVEAKVAFIYPYLDPQTRTGRIRLELDNPKDESGRPSLRPGMFVDVEITIDLGEHTVVPESAVIFAGRRRLVFVDLGDDRLQPREVQLGQKSEDAYVVESGVEPGTVVVTSANFLIAAESRLKSAIEQW